MPQPDKAGGTCLHLMAGRGAQEGSIEVEVGGLHQAAVVQGASWRHPDHHLQQICAPAMPCESDTRRHGGVTCRLMSERWAASVLSVKQMYTPVGASATVQTEP